MGASRDLCGDFLVGVILALLSSVRGKSLILISMTDKLKVWVAHYPIYTGAFCLINILSNIVPVNNILNAFLSI